MHVDDFLLAYRSDYDIQTFKSHFKWGSETELSLGTHIVFRGKEVSLHHGEKNDIFYIKVTQQAFIKEMTVGSLPRGRLTNGDARLSVEEQKEFRSCTGSLQWLAGQCRPDVSSTVSLSNKGTDSTPEDLGILYQCMRDVRDTPELGLIYFPVSFDKAMHLVAHGDSSWANAPGLKSQMGVIVLLTSPLCLQQTTPATIMDWKSARSPRVTRSTLAAEAVAMDEAVDRSSYINYFLTELVYSDQKDALFQRRLKQLQVTDCKSLYDAILAPNPTLTEKRTIITVRSIQEYIHAQDLRWTPTEVMWADGLTKCKPDLLHAFREWLLSPVVTIVEKDKHVSKKKAPV